MFLHPLLHSKVKIHTFGRAPVWLVARFLPAIGCCRENAKIPLSEQVLAGTKVLDAVKIVWQNKRIKCNITAQTNA